MNARPAIPDPKKIDLSLELDQVTLRNINCNDLEEVIQLASNLLFYRERWQDEQAEEYHCKLARRLGLYREHHEDFLKRQRADEARQQQTDRDVMLRNQMHAKLCAQGGAAHE